MQLFHIAKDVTPLWSNGSIALICAIVRTFQINITPLVSLEINRFALAMRAEMPDWWPRLKIFECRSLQTAMRFLPRMVSLRVMFVPFWGMLNTRISPRWFPMRINLIYWLYVSLRSCTYQHRVNSDQYRLYLVNRSMTLKEDKPWDWYEQLK